MPSSFPLLDLVIRTVLLLYSACHASAWFVTTNNGQFTLNGSEFKFIGTNAYWLPTLNSEQDIVDTLGSISAQGLKVVRTWAFNDVDTIPDDNSTWFQLISKNGTVQFNDGPNGIPKLDFVVRTAEQMGLRLQLSLTNNWNPLPLNDTLQAPSIFRRDITLGTNNSLPRNTLSNDYGGMDLYLRSLTGGSSTHDQFYTNETIIIAFENYIHKVVSRYVNSPAIFSWEVANDARCNSSIPASSECTPQVVTRWHARIAKRIREIDPNHLVTSGSQGFFCVDCPKLFPRTQPPQPQSSASASASKKRKASPLTKSQLVSERKALFKVTRDKLGQIAANQGPKIRGRWSAGPAKRQADNGLGSAFDGSHGVDSEDIMNIPELGFGTFQLFPDQNSYGSGNPSLPAFNQTVQEGLDWIRRQANSGLVFGKPVSMSGFGLVTQHNSPFFVPSNSSIAPFANQTNSTSPTSTANSTTNSTQPYGVTDQQQQDAYGQWMNASISNGISGVTQYQWGQSNLTTQQGSAIVPDQSNTTGISPNLNATGVSPNDGYSNQGVGQDSVQSVTQQAVQGIAGGP